MDWNDNNVERMKAMLAEGQSASQMAYALGTSRNAVIGKLSRLGLPAGGGMRTSLGRPRVPRAASEQTIDLNSAKAKRAELRTAARADEPAPVLDAEGAAITLRTAMRNQCRWMPGQPHLGELQICANPTADGKPWCPHHAGRAIAAIAAMPSGTAQPNTAVPAVHPRASAH